MASVDIVVPCYKYAHFLETCIDSVLAQKGVELRVLIVDDCSPDKTGEIAAGLVSRDDRVSYVRNPQNLGLIGTMNRGGLEWAKADYTMALSADDALADGALACLASSLGRNPTAHMAYGTARIFRDHLPAAVERPTPETMSVQTILEDAFLTHCCTVGNPAPSPTVMVRTESQKRTGGYNPRFRHTSDMEMWMRMATLGPVVAIKETLGFYRLHGANMSSELADPWTDLRERLATCEYVFKRWEGRRFRNYSTAVRGMRGVLLERALKAAVFALHEQDWKNYDAQISFADHVRPRWRLSPNGLRLQSRHALGWRRYTDLGNRLTTLKFPETPPQPTNSDWRGGNSDLYGWWPAPTSPPIG